MKKTTKLLSIVALVATLFFAACKKEDTPAPVADFTILPNDTIEFFDTLRLTNTSTNADTYLWNFGDGTTSTQTNPIKASFNRPGTSTGCTETYTITLTATKNGKSSTKSKTVLVGYCL